MHVIRADDGDAYAVAAGAQRPGRAGCEQAHGECERECLQVTDAS
jgi:hypothetical protein